MGDILVLWKFQTLLQRDSVVRPIPLFIGIEKSPERYRYLIGAFVLRLNEPLVIHLPFGIVTAMYSLLELFQV